MMKNYRPNGLLTLKCELLFQMTGELYLFLFTPTVGSIQFSIERHLCNLDYKPMPLVKN